jgi:ATP-dependent Clp protease ATP-binding subunit ClpA
MQETHFTHKLTFHARHSLQESRSLALFAKSLEVGPEHLLLAIFLENGSLGNNLLENMGFEKERLSKLCLKKGISRKRITPNEKIVPPSEGLKKVLERAYSIASQFQSPYVGTEHFVYALLEADDAALDDIFLELDIDERKIEATLATHMGFEKLPDLARLFDMQESRQDIAFGKTRTVEAGSTPTLNTLSI